MPDVLTIRVCGVDRQPLPVAFDLRVIDADAEPERVVSERKQWSHTVLVQGLLPTVRYRVEVTARGYRPAAWNTIGPRELEFWLELDPQTSKAIWPTTYPEPLLATVPCDQVWSLDDHERAGLLNLYAKLAQTNLWRFLTGVTACRRDRLFADVSEELLTELVLSSAFKPVDGSLHTPPDGFHHAGSFKERHVKYGGLQVTLFKNEAGVFRADIDIDDAAGFEHGGQVIGHALTGGCTHPYAIHQKLVLQGIDPGYRLVA